MLRTRVAIAIAIAIAVTLIAVGNHLVGRFFHRSCYDEDFTLFPFPMFGTGTTPQIIVAGVVFRADTGPTVQTFPRR